MARPTLRSFLFWPHLVSGLLAGLVVAVMSFTGVMLAFAPQLLAASDREAREVAAPAPGTARLGVDALLARVKAERPDFKVSGVTVYPEATRAVLVSSGRTGSLFVNPYTGELREPGGSGLRQTLHAMEDWHRWLGAEGEHRAVGKAITGAANTLFLFLALSGLYLWWPRRWTRAALRSTTWFRGGLRGKARDFNWHNVIGFWMLPVLIVLTASGMVISYRWASNLVFTLTGSPVPPAPGAGGPGAGTGGPGAGGPSAAGRRAGGSSAAPGEGAEKRAPEARPLPLEAMFARASQQVPAWESIALRLGAPGGGPGARGPQPLTFTVREPDAWPRFATLQLTLDPVSGSLLKREGYADGNLGRRVRTWLRFLHTGEALGLPGQAVAALASFGALFLVWTGFALSWRRFFPRRRATPEVPATSLPDADASNAPGSKTSAA